MLKIKVNHAKVRVVAQFKVNGSVLRGDIHSEMVGVESRLELDSTEPPEKIARLVEMAERGCFIMNALRDPIPVRTEVLVNGSALALPEKPSGG